VVCNFTPDIVRVDCNIQDVTCKREVRGFEARDRSEDLGVCWRDNIKLDLK
jgi:hypothetical protein